MPPDEIDRSELLDLYKLVIEEYRFQIKLNSDRTQFYLVFNAAIITAATGLFKVGVTATAAVIAAILILGVVVALLTSSTVKRGHEYYRRVVYKKTLIEELLGRHQQIEGDAYPGATLAIETTIGMAEKRRILDQSESWLSRPILPTNITGGLILTFRIVAIIELFGIFYVLVIAR